MPLEDPNDPNVVARGQRLRNAYQQFMRNAPTVGRLGGGAQVSIAQNMFLPTDGSAQMASEYKPTDSLDVVTLAALQQLFADYGVTPPAPAD